MPVTRTGGMKVLVVDDELAFATLLRLRLERLGHQAIVACNGEHALELMTPDVDAVIADIEMPQMDGIELARRLRAGRGDLPIVLATASMPAADVAPEAADMATVIEKEWSFERVQETVSALQARSLEALDVAIDQLMRRDLARPE